MSDRLTASQLLLTLLAQKEKKNRESAFHVTLASWIPTGPPFPSVIVVFQSHSHEMSNIFHWMPRIFAYTQPKLSGCHIANWKVRK